MEAARGAPTRRRTMSHWQLQAVTAALSRFEKVGSGRANMTLKAGSSQAGNSDSSMMRVIRCTSAGRRRRFSSRVSVRMPSNLRCIRRHQQHSTQTTMCAALLMSCWASDVLAFPPRTLALERPDPRQQPASATRTSSLHQAPTRRSSTANYADVVLKA